MCDVCDVMWCDVHLADVVIRHPWIFLVHCPFIAPAITEVVEWRSWEFRHVKAKVQIMYEVASHWDLGRIPPVDGLRKDARNGRLHIELFSVSWIDKFVFKGYEHLISQAGWPRFRIMDLN